MYIRFFFCNDGVLCTSQEQMLCYVLFSIESGSEMYQKCITANLNGIQKMVLEANYYEIYTLDVNVFKCN